MSTLGLRRAAVALARLHGRDRRWVLRHLADEEARALRKLLKQRSLRMLMGVPQMPAEVIEAAPVADAVDDMQLVVTLDALAPAWVALWMSAVPAERAARDLEHLSSDKAQSVRELLSDGAQKLPPALTRAIAGWTASARVEATT